ncbi:hypothetical protein [Nonomuraea dietziae]|uniref:hypothetical protein n=1 Tax=Nonomuraea dietziae TaxID=65515 RepID=UPI0034190B8C
MDGPQRPDDDAADSREDADAVEAEDRHDGDGDAVEEADPEQPVPQKALVHEQHGHR